MSEPAKKLIHLEIPNALYETYDYNSYTQSLDKIIYTENVKHMDSSLPINFLSLDNAHDLFNSKLDQVEKIFTDKINHVCKNIVDKQIENKENNNHPFVLLDRKEPIWTRDTDNNVLTFQAEATIYILLKQETETVDEAFKRWKI